MRTFAKKPKATQQATSPKASIPTRSHFGHSHEVNTILHLQCTIGNQAVQRLLRRNAEERNAVLSGTNSPQFGYDFSRIPVRPPTVSGIQTKLAINKPGDEYEQEADRVAEQFMKMSEPKLQRACACSGACPKCKTEQRSQESKRLQTKRVRVSNTEQVAAPPIVHDVLQSPGQPLQPATRAFMEARFGHDFSHVRVHADAKASESAKAVNALAYTVRQDVVFGAGRFEPDTREGKRLLAHELTHVVQQQNRSHQWPTIQRDLALEPPRPAATGRVLTADEMREAIAYNNRVIGAGGPDLIREVRDVIGTSPEPAVVDEDFVNAVVTWQAMQGLVQDGKLGPRTAAPLFREIGAEGVGECRVQNGATYTPAAPAVVPAGGGAETAHFALSADFENDPANRSFPSCCEVRQFIRWNDVSAAAFGPTGVPHTGFPAGTPANRFIEDRDDANNRYGHRSGRFSDPQPFDQYLDATGNRNQAFGHLYRGTDDPTPIAAHAVGQWQFYLRVNDVCNGGRRVGGDSLIRINW